MKWSSQLLEASRKPRNQRASPACWMRQGLYHRQFVGSYHGGPNSPSGPIMGGYINRTVMIQQGQPAYLYLDGFDCPKSKLPTQWLDMRRYSETLLMKPPAFISDVWAPSSRQCR
jgi:hypothetical protein